MLYVRIAWLHHLFILMVEIHPVGVLLKFIHAKDVKNADIEQMQYFKVHIHMLHALTN